MQMTGSDQAPSQEIGPPPRPVTRRAARRSWMETRVRTWWLAGLALAVVAGYFTARVVLHYMADRRLFSTGIAVRAEIRDVDGAGLKNKLYDPAERLHFGFQFALPTPGGIPAEIQHPGSNPASFRLKTPLPEAVGPDWYVVFTGASNTSAPESGASRGAIRRVQSLDSDRQVVTLDEALLKAVRQADTVEFHRDLVVHKITSRLKDQRDFTGPGLFLDLHVDPADPQQHWTDRVNPFADPDQRWWIAWAKSLLVGLLVMPLALVSFIVAAVQRHRVLAVWKNGLLLNGVVVGTGHTALAPLSIAVRYTLREAGGGGRVHSIVVPAPRGHLRAGAALRLIALPGKPGRAIAADLYGYG